MLYCLVQNTTAPYYPTRDSIGWILCSCSFLPQLEIGTTDRGLWSCPSYLYLRTRIAPTRFSLEAKSSRPFRRWYEKKPEPRPASAREHDKYISFGCPGPVDEPELLRFNSVHNQLRFVSSCLSDWPLSGLNTGIAESIRRQTPRISLPR